MNKVTKAKREALIAKAAELLHQDLNGNQVVAQLVREGVSTQRARHAVAKVRLRENRPLDQEEEKEEMEPQDYVHEYKGRFIIAEYRDGTYYAPQRPDVRKLTGCNTTFGPLSYVAGDAYNYSRRSDAIRSVRKMYMLDD